ncbi:hypothetical protein HMPREF1548_03476 [Clostridium sp. KLE 1755]|nr:hypothetical protein HMPREF1548_03476 [Clostridium sp. KLE 1755]
MSYFNFYQGIIQYLYHQYVHNAVVKSEMCTEKITVRPWPDCNQ